MALVIGNSAYENATTLPNTRNDANDVSAALKRVGFEVFEGVDLDHPGMRRAVRDFSTAIKGAEVALFFYAGHALQLGNKNHLLPVSATLVDESDLDFVTVELSLILRQMKRNARTSLIFLDACRDNPLSRSLAASMGPSRSANLGRGLAPVERVLGSFVAFATAPGDVASDGNGRNSPFTKALLDHIDTPGQSINQMMIEIRNDVVARTNGQQIPWDHSSLTGNFFFVEPKSTLTATSPQSSETAGSTDKEVLFWQSIQESANPASYEAYLKRFPTGTFSDLARLRLDELEDEQETASHTSPAESAKAEEEPAFTVEHVNKTYWVLKRSNVRSGPGTSFEKIGRLQVGEEVEVTGTIIGKDWFRIALENKQHAYIYAPSWGSRNRSQTSIE